MIRKDREATPHIPLNIWTDSDWGHLTNFGICHVCRTALEGTHRTARDVCWDRLPEIYGLPSWPELEAIKAAAIGVI
jgi:hypothetical protein